jgi:hypothetical protein
MLLDGYHTVSRKYYVFSQLCALIDVADGKPATLACDTCIKS